MGASKVPVTCVGDGCFLITATMKKLKYSVLI